MLNVALIGAGLQGRRRVAPVLANKNCNLSWVIDRNLERAQSLAAGTQATTAQSFQAVLEDPNVQLALVLTPPDSHFEITSALLKKGIHVLCEKPMTRNSVDAEKLVDLAKENKVILKCGFNHRHHPAVLEAYKRLKEGQIGKPVFIRGKYGIGGRTDIKTEWRANPEIVAGGQLMEQGIHLLDLISWFTGGVSEVSCMTSTAVFPIAPLEDNAFVTLRSKSGTLSSVHSTLCQWINEFEFEIYGEKGFLAVEGLGASYGIEKLKFGINTPGKPFNYETIEYRGGDSSWTQEWDEFLSSIADHRQPIGSGADGAQAVRLVEMAYLSNKSLQTQKL